MMEPQGGDAQADAVRRLTSTVRLVIPTRLEPSDEYRARIGDLLARDDTHVYVDTSFLMWATKIGPASRGELLEWLRTDIGERVHVPTWSAHEYLRHHVAGTIVDELTRKSGEVSQLAGSTFSYFRPFLDDPALPAAEGWDRLRASTRDAINTLGRLAQAAKDWKRAYRAHAEQIIEYINERVLPVGRCSRSCRQSRRRERPATRGEFHQATKTETRRRPTETMTPTRRPSRAPTGMATLFSGRRQ